MASQLVRSGVVIHLPLKIFHRTFGSLQVRPPPPIASFPEEVRAVWHPALSPVAFGVLTDIFSSLGCDHARKVWAAC